MIRMFHDQIDFAIFPIGWDIAGTTYRKEQKAISDSVAILGAKL